LATAQKHKNITIGILPFQVASEDERTNTLFFGFTEDLISNFSKFAGLTVISSYSTRKILDTGNQEQIKELGADFLIFGNVYPKIEKLRISLQLIKASDQSLVFAGHHDETMDSLMEAQDHIIQQIVSVLQEKINYNLLSHSYEKKSVDRAAYENYLLGMSILRKGTAKSDKESRVYFKEALKANPNYSLAYTGLSLSYFNYWSCLLWDRWEISQKGAHDYALKAQEIDPNDYIALGVLGRTYVYLNEFEKAEHCLRKSLRMNSNDATHLLRVSHSLLYLGYTSEAVKLYLKAIAINPFHDDVYYAYGSTYYLESGEFETSIELSKKTGFGAWTDFPAFVAAAYLQVEDYDNLLRCWNIFIENFRKNIYTSQNPIEEEALEWLRTINPYKGFSYLYPLIDYMASENSIEISSKAPEANSIYQPKFQPNGDVWNLHYKNKSVILKDVKGYHDIHKMLSEPIKEFHCLDLMSSTIEEKSAAETLDQKAKAQYLKRIQELQEEIEEAETLQNGEKIGLLQEEYDFIVSHLSNSTGLAGKSRKVGSTMEKARSAVTWRIRSAIKKIDQHHTALANHLSKSIKTGTFCSYTPENRVDWEL
jgi:TolB-like protein